MRIHPCFRRARVVGLLPFICLGLHTAKAGSATWNVNPVSGDWNDPANWTPNTVPNGPDDIATFGFSSITTISIGSFIELHSLVIDPGASAFTFNVLSSSLLTFTGTGIVNNSGQVQNFTGKDQGDGPGAFQFNGSSTAGTDTFFTNTWITNFDENGSAGDTTINCTGGYSYFYGNSTAANATIIANGTSSTEVGWSLVSLGSGTAANATLIATDGTIAGGEISLGFIGTAGSNTARVQLHGNGSLIVNSGSVGSLEGDGVVLIEPFANLHIGANNLSTTFSGKIKGDRPFANPLDKGDRDEISFAVGSDNPSSASGAITKEGSGTLTLTGDNTYSNGTTVTSGVLLVSNTSGSGTGKAAVAVNGGTLGGSGIIAGAVTVGTNTGVHAFLAPSKAAKKPATLTIQSLLTLNGDSTYVYQLNTKRAVSDEVIANGVTIGGGAKFSLRPSGNNGSSVGQVFTVISNTATTPIAGAFQNLPEGKILIVNGSKLQASYTGGDGNDLTLTVVP
jgi:autotransporter-associated beta strand protein